MSDQSPTSVAWPESRVPSHDALAVHVSRTRRVIVCGATGGALALVTALLAPLLVPNVGRPVVQPAPSLTTNAPSQVSPIAVEAFDAPLWTVALPPPPPPKPAEPPPPPPLACELIGIEGIEGDYRAVVYDTAADVLRSLRTGDVINQRAEESMEIMRRAGLTVRVLGNDEKTVWANALPNMARQRMEEMRRNNQPAEAVSTYVQLVTEAGHRFPRDWLNS